MRELVKKAGLDIDPKFQSKADSNIFPRLFKEYGLDTKFELKENGCQATAR